MMRTLMKAAISIALMFFLLHPTWSQSKVNTGAISGRITYDSKPLAGVTIALYEGYWLQPDQPASKQAVTDSDGRFQLTGVSAGTYIVKPLTPNLYNPESQEDAMRFFGTGKMANIGTGELVTGVDFNLRRGAVITGRVVDGNHQPIIEEKVQVIAVDEEKRRYSTLEFHDSSMAMTDDRGKYRIYGLPPGKYLIKIGESKWRVSKPSGSSRRIFQETYHPDITDDRKAKPIEVQEGEEISNIDITVLGGSLKTFKVTGRVIDVETGKPVAGLTCAYQDGTFSGMGQVLGVGRSSTNAKGEFSFEGVLAGEYSATIQSQSEYYSDDTKFKVEDADVTGVEVKVHRGAVIVGKVVIEATDEEKSLSPLLPIVVTAKPGKHLMDYTGASSAQVEADGSFRLFGVRPGEVNITAMNNMQGKKLWLLYVEYAGKNISEGMEVKAEDKITGVRIAVGAGSGVIRGEVQLKNWEWSRMSEAWVYVMPKTKYGEIEMVNLANMNAIDSNGRFFVSSVPPGEYVVHIKLEPYMRPDLYEEQTVIVTKGKDTQVKFVVDLKASEDKDN